MPLCPPVFDALSTLLAAYERSFDRALTSTGDPDLREPDAAFAQLRQAVSRHWPQGNSLIESIGVRSNDLLDALAAGRPLGAPHHAHARALSDLRVLLRSPAADGVRSQAGGR